MEELVRIENAVKERSYSWITAILFWCGLVVVSSLYLTIPLVSIFAYIFKVTAAQATWTSSAFSFFYALGFLFFGPLSDRYGRKQIILFGLIILTIVSPILGFLDSLPTLVVFRALQGVAAATFAPSALAYVVEIFPEEKRVTAIGFVSTGFLMAGIVGQVFSSFISQQLGWNSVFYCLGGIYFITAILVTLFIPKGGIQNKDGSLLVTYKQMGAVLTNKSLLFCYLITVTLLLSFVGMYATLGNYLSLKFNLGNQQILYIRSVGIIGMFLSPFAGRLVAKFGIYNVLRGGLTLAVIGLTILGFSSNLLFLIMMSVVFVAGISIIVPTLISLVSQLGGQARGIAVTLYTFILFIGATIGPIIAVSILKTGSYLLTFEVLAILLGIGLFVSFAIKPDKQDYQKSAKNEVEFMSQIQQNNKDKTYQNALNEVLETISVPIGYEFKKVHSGKQNDADVWIFRFEKANQKNNGLGGEHYSFTVDKDSHTILGITWMDQRFTSGQQLPSEKRTEELVKSFLNSIQVGLFDRLENHWIRPHDEIISVNGGEKITVTGMKYKCYLPDEDTWAWVIVGPDEKIITFEQGIKWEGGRVTEKWLHDNWLLENQY